MAEFNPHVKEHLYETAHSGFYSENPSATVNLLPKTWTKYTVTDGDWMTKNTLEPLWNRDIYLANKIDEVDNDKFNHYKAGDHIKIDYNTNTISVNPFDIEYSFTGGVLFNKDRSYVYSDEPTFYGGITNKLSCDNEGLYYAHRQGHENTGADINVDEHIGTMGLTNESIPSFPDNATVVYVTSSQYIYNNDNVNSGEWLSGTWDYWDEATQQRKHIEYDEEPSVTAVIDNNIDNPSSNCFDPFDQRRFEYNAYMHTVNGGLNFLQGSINFVPTGVLFIYD